MTPLRILSLVALLTSPVNAIAQQGNTLQYEPIGGDRTSSWNSKMNLKGGDVQADANAYEKLRTYADCAQRISPQGTANLLSSKVMSGAENLAMKKLVRSTRGCAGTMGDAPMLLFRGAISEAIINADDPNSIAQTAPLRGVDPEEIPGPVTGSLEEFVKCQMFLAPKEAVDLLAASPNTGGEITALNTLFVAAEKCGGRETLPEGLRIYHRALMAQGLYETFNAAGLIRPDVK